MCAQISPFQHLVFAGETFFRSKCGLIFTYKLFVELKSFDLKCGRDSWTKLSLGFSGLCYWGLAVGGGVGVWFKSQKYSYIEWNTYTTHSDTRLIPGNRTSKSQVWHRFESKFWPKSWLQKFDLETIYEKNRQILKRWDRQRTPIGWWGLLYILSWNGMLSVGNPSQP